MSSQLTIAPAPRGPAGDRTDAPRDRRPSDDAHVHGVRATRATYWRRRATVVVALLAAAFLITGVIGRAGAEAELEDKVAGHVVVQPGETLWDVAVATAPDGMDPREHLLDLRELNEIDGSQVEAWTVVLIPAR